MATIASPEKMAGSSQPMVDRMGLMATLKTWRVITRMPGAPLARAVTTYCLPSSSRVVARITRIVPAVPAVPRTTTGTQRCVSRSHSLAQLQSACRNSRENRPPIVMPNQDQPNHISTSASRKFGIDSPRKPRAVNR